MINRVSEDNCNNKQDYYDYNNSNLRLNILLTFVTESDKLREVTGLQSTNSSNTPATTTKHSQNALSDAQIVKYSGHRNLLTLSIEILKSSRKIVFLQPFLIKSMKIVSSSKTLYFFFPSESL